MAPTEGTMAKPERQWGCRRGNRNGRWIYNAGV